MRCNIYRKTSPNCWFTSPGFEKNDILEWSSFMLSLVCIRLAILHIVLNNFSPFGRSFVLSQTGWKSPGLITRVHKKRQTAWNLLIWGIQLNLSGIQSLHKSLTDLRYTDIRSSVLLFQLLNWKHIAIFGYCSSFLILLFTGQCTRTSNMFNCMINGCIIIYNVFTNQLFTT